MNTLKGVFPEEHPVPKRNFIRENMLQVKRMQGLTVNCGADISSISRKHGKVEHISEDKTLKLIRNTRKQLQTLAVLSNSNKPKMLQNNPMTPNQKSRKPTSGDIKTAVETFREDRRCRHKEIGIQTDTQNRQNFETGIVKYPSLKSSQSRGIRSPGNIGDGDRYKKRSPSSENQDTVDQVGEKEIGERRPRDYVKENAQMITKSCTSKNALSNDPTMPPATYQKGVVPKYLRERKEEILKHSSHIAGDEKCPEGHVVLPECERKETLRMLRQSYSELINELNQLPVRSDTLKVRNRKIEIENQLKKLDEGIKVFNRPKVYVKIGG